MEQRGGADVVTVSGLLESLDAAAATQGGRRLVGIAGSPGVGKSTLASALARRWNARPSHAGTAAYVPMDGFHLSNAALARLGRSGRKGAPDTFDAAGYVALLRRLRDDDAGTVWAPMFDRALEEPIAGAIAVDAPVRLVLTEGNYLLLDDPDWVDVPPVLDETWFLDAPDDVRVERLVARHVAYGRTPDDARAWALATDAPNAERVAASRGRADRVITLPSDAVA